MCWWICNSTSLKLSCHGVAIDALWGKWDDDPRPYFFHLGQYVQMRQTKYIPLSKQIMVQWKLSVLEISNWSSREQQIPRNERNFSGVGETHSKKKCACTQSGEEHISNHGEYRSITLFLDYNSTAFRPPVLRLPALVLLLPMLRNDCWYEFWICRNSHLRKSRIMWHQETS